LASSTKSIATPPEEDRATTVTTIVDTHRKLGEANVCGFDRERDRRQQTNRQTDTLIRILRSAAGGKVNIGDIQLK